MKNIILASSSPRRKEILDNLGINFEVVPSNYCEEMLKGTAEEIVCELAKNKAIEVAKRIKKDAIIIAADTLVYKDFILGKPKTENEAFQMLKLLSGDMHKVVTGLFVIDTKDSSFYQEVETTNVFFKELTDEEIWDYVYTGEPMDKAGGYGIQGKGSFFVKKIDGCYFNVVGLPIHKLYNIMKRMGVNLIVKEV
ncbi:septum formation protein Maf [Fervidicella metallireducens AeB]|uniref:dTTP/UTP pyrophosphatase n=1 Tax=Fervidicella metallireducens AeB TaxID=1403537 RepID=A0A017RV24_9CLOT|nr:Maf family protein [Fervidicella metallireducens]EYE88456.1 septum formation protein Maf [Fervidicella metallireducens AeB]